MFIFILHMLVTKMLQPQKHFIYSKKKFKNKKINNMVSYSYETNGNLCHVFGKNLPLEIEPGKKTLSPLCL